MDMPSFSSLIYRHFISSIPIAASNANEHFPFGRKIAMWGFFCASVRGVGSPLPPAASSAITPPFPS